MGGEGSRVMFDDLSVTLAVLSPASQRYILAAL
jgi:hypothetical protein